MKAVVLDAFGDISHLKLKKVDMPYPKKGEVRIKIKAAGFNPVDFKIRQGLYGGDIPCILGADCSGIIDAVGEGVTSVRVSDEVVGLTFGQCSNGSYAEYVCLPEEFVAKKPKNISFEQGASLPVVSLTAYRSMISCQALKKGDSIFIAGAGGGVGSFAVSLAKHLSVSSIYSVARNKESANYLCQELGLQQDHILIYENLSTPQIEDKLLKMHFGKRFDATFDFVGGNMKQLCLLLTTHSGHFSTAVPENEPFDFGVWERGSSLAFGKNLSLHFIFVGAEAFSGPKESWPLYSKQLSTICHWIELGKIQIPPIQNLGELSEETVKKAHHLLEEGRVKGKLIMSVNTV